MELLTIHFKAIGLLGILNSHIIVQLSVFRLETTRGPIKKVMGRSITISRILKRWSNPHNILDRKDSNTSRQNTTLAGEQVVFIMWTSSR